MFRIIEHEVFCSSVLLTMADVMRDACSSCPFHSLKNGKAFIISLGENISLTCYKGFFKRSDDISVEEKSCHAHHKCLADAGNLLIL